MCGGYYTVHVHYFMMHLKDCEINITININHEHIPFIAYRFVSSEEKENRVSHLWPELDCSDIIKIDFFGYFKTIWIHCY